MQVVADLHLHSKYSRAVSPQMLLPTMPRVAAQKGIHLLGTGDFTHPLWMHELREKLVETGNGIYSLKGTEDQSKFLVSVEIATIYTQNGKGRRIHNVVLVPSLEVAERINESLIAKGCTLGSDGRPIIGLSSKNLLELLLSIDERCLLIPAHAWTPWFGVYGLMSGFVSLDEAFEDLAPYVYAIETGISSDPEMNWQMKELAHRSIVSFSDAHSLPKMGRELTVFDMSELSYNAIRTAIMRADEMNQKIAYTVEFFPEEGKYHYSGHRQCGFFFRPEDEVSAKGICLVCHRPVTDGVMRRVQEISQEKPRGVKQIDASGVSWITDPKQEHPSFVRLVPLQEIIAEVLSRPVTSPKVQSLFDEMIQKISTELDILLTIPLTTISSIAGERIAEGVAKVRSGELSIAPGYDGLYGKVSIWDKQPKEEQLVLNI